MIESQSLSWQCKSPSRPSMQNLFPLPYQVGLEVEIFSKTKKTLVTRNSFPNEQWRRFSKIFNYEKE